MTFSDLNIFMIEDDLSFVETTKMFLGVHNQISSIDNLKSALEIIQNKRYDLFLIDKNLSDGDGTELIKPIKDLYPNSPVIIISADKNYYSINKCIELGADDYIIKSDQLICDLNIRIPISLNKYQNYNTSHQQVLKEIKIPLTKEEINKENYKEYISNCRKAYFENGLNLCQGDIKNLSTKLEMTPGTLYNYSSSMGHFIQKNKEI